MIWGPASPEASLRDRIARYISAPLSPVEVRELPCDVSFRHCPEAEWEIGPARIRAASVAHRGPTLGYRIDDGDSSLAYIPDHEPALGADLDELDEDWISGFALARDASLLIHDGQYTDAEYPEHVGWGHSALAHSLSFARRSDAERTVLFHHDPMHSDDFLDGLGAEARGRGRLWAARRGDRAGRRGRRVRAAGAGAEPGGDRVRTLSFPPSIRRPPEERRPLPCGQCPGSLLSRLDDRVDSPAIEAATDRSPLVAEALRGARGPRRADPQRQRRHALHRAPGGRRGDARRAGFGEEVLAAALLHDVVEDSEMTVAELRERFGEPVAGLVAALSDDESIASYRARKDEHRARVPAAGTDALAIYAADKLTNVSALRGAYAEQGEEVAEELKVPLDLKIGIWEADLEMLVGRRPPPPFLDRLEAELELLREERAEASAGRAA